MANPYGVPEITVQEVVNKKNNDESFIWIDVREAQEYGVSIQDDSIVRLPLSELAARQLDALPDEIASNKEAEIIAFCHHGMRSAQVVAWLSQQGWTNVINMDGGIDAWANEIDPSIGTY